MTANEHDEIYSITILLSHNPKVEVTWHILSEELIVKKDTEILGMRLPYFEPDFSNYPKLLDKLRTYMVFS